MIMSGSVGEGREHAVVGFIVAPGARPAIAGFLQLSSRIACLKMRVAGGKLSMISAYAPHEGHSYDQRQQFYSELDSAYAHTSANGLRLVFGDFNSRFHRQQPGEEDIIGGHVFRTDRPIVPNSNRELLLELCASHSLAVANSFT